MVNHSGYSSDMDATNAPNGDPTMADATIPMRHELWLTETEAEMWDWAADPCIEFFAPDSIDRNDDERNVYEDAVTVSERRGNFDVVGGKSPCYRVTIVHDIDVSEDMIYRLADQLPDMFHQADVGRINEKGRGDAERMKALRELAAAKRVAAKIRLIFGLDA